MLIPWSQGYKAPHDYPPACASDLIWFAPFVNLPTTSWAARQPGAPPGFRATSCGGQNAAFLQPTSLFQCSLFREGFSRPLSHNCHHILLSF